MIDCEAADGLAGAFALRALPSDELRDMEKHIASCDSHPQVAEMQRTVAAIALATQELEPGTHFRARIIDAIASGREPSGPPAARTHRVPLFRGIPWARIASYAVAILAGLAVGVALGAVFFG